MDVSQALLTGVYGFLVTLGFLGAAVVALMATGLLAWIVKKVLGDG